MPLGIPRGARCVQRFDDSRNSAIHITYRISLRSSSMREPRDPLLKVVSVITFLQIIHKMHSRAPFKKCEMKEYIGQTQPEGGVCLQDVHKGVMEIVNCSGSAHLPLRRGQQHPQITSVMILPQVHLRKPCYDFYFL
jgi:hypothetical protein